MNRSQSLLIVAVAYVLAFVLGILLVMYLPEGNNLGKLFFIDVVLTLFIFMFSFRFGNASVYDPYWSVIPAFIVLYWWHQSLANPDYIVWGTTVFLVFAWSVRLTHNWARGWQGMHQQDWRYLMLQEKSGKWYLMVNFLGIHMFPTLVVWLASVPIAYILTSSEPFSWINWMGAGLAACGIILELISDNQLRRFKKKGLLDEVFTSGIWGYVRHPNYLGEILFWWGLYVMSINALTPMYVMSGALGITLMFMFISVPMMDKHMLQKRPSYAHYMLKVKGLIPFIK